MPDLTNHEPSKTPRTIALMRDPLNSNDLRAWQSLAAELEGSISESIDSHNKLAVDFEKLQYSYSEVCQDRDNCAAELRAAADHHRAHHALEDDPYAEECRAMLAECRKQVEEMRRGEPANLADWIKDLDAILAKSPESFLEICHHKGSDGEEVRSLPVGGAQLAQTGSDVGGMPLSVGRSRPDKTATSSEGVTLHGGWTVPMEPMDMLLTIAERRVVPLGTIVYIFEAMRELAEAKGSHAVVPKQPPTPFMWYDHFNGHVWKRRSDAKKAASGGNKVSPMYLGNPEDAFPEGRAPDSPQELHSQWIRQPGLAEALSLIREVEGDNGANFGASPSEIEGLASALQRMARAGCPMTVEVFAEIAAGEESEVAAQFGPFDGYADLSSTLNAIFMRGGVDLVPAPERSGSSSIVSCGVCLNTGKVNGATCPYCAGECNWAAA